MISKPSDQFVGSMMKKIEIVSKALELYGYHSKDALIVTAKDNQKVWRDSDFKVYSKNRSFSDKRVLVFDNKESKDLELNINKAKLVISFKSLAKSVKTAEKLIKEVSQSNLDYRNSLELDINPKLDYGGDYFSIFDGSKKIRFISKDRESLEDLKEVFEPGKDKSVYLSWVSALKERLQEKKKEIKLKEKDIDSLESHISCLKDDFSAKMEDLKEEKEDKIERMKQENQEKKEEIEQLVEEKDSEVERLINEKEEFRQELEDREEQVKQLKEELSELKKSFPHRVNRYLKSSLLGGVEEE